MTIRMRQAAPPEDRKESTNSKGCINTVTLPKTRREIIY